MHPYSNENINFHISLYPMRLVTNDLDCLIVLFRLKHQAKDFDFKSYRLILVRGVHLIVLQFIFSHLKKLRIDYGFNY